jgi:hypothetical protein
MPEWTSPALAIVSGLIVLGLTYYGARRVGLTDLQKAVRSETETLVLRLKDQVAALERDNAELRAKIVELRISETALKGRVDILEQTLADQAVARRSSRAG